jgi:hypothetical protein
VTARRIINASFWIALPLVVAASILMVRASNIAKGELFGLIGPLFFTMVARRAGPKHRGAAVVIALVGVAAAVFELYAGLHQGPRLPHP